MTNMTNQTNMTNIRSLQVRLPRDIRDDLAETRFAPNHRTDDESFLISSAGSYPFLQGEQPFHEECSIPRLSRLNMAIDLWGFSGRHSTGHS